ncbi:unnamed protein product, partial [Mesorhabditis spiculigera]
CRSFPVATRSLDDLEAEFDALRAEIARLAHDHRIHRMDWLRGGGGRDMFSHHKVWS